MIRRKLTLKRVDPWSVLKFGFVVNVALLLVGLLAFWILWIAIRRLGLIDQFCGSVGTIVLDLQQCSVNGGNIFRTVLFLGALGVVVQTGIVVFGAFLYNLIADLTGGLTFSFLDESGDAAPTSSRRSVSQASGSHDDARASPSAGGGGASPAGVSRGATSSGAAAGTTAGAGSAGTTREPSSSPHDTGSFRPSPRPGPAGDRGPERPAGSPPGSSTDARSEGGPPRPPQDRGRDAGGSSPPTAPRSASPSGERPSGTSPGPAPGGQGSASGSEGSDEAQQDEDASRDEQGREDDRPPRPSGSSLWGDPTRSRE